MRSQSAVSTASERTTSSNSRIRRRQAETLSSSACARKQESIEAAEDLEWLADHFDELSAEEQAEIAALLEAECRRDASELVTFADLKIRTKDKRIIPFEPNAVQRIYLADLCPRWEEGIFDLRGLRELILKARQQGFSTLILAIFFCITLNEPNTQTIVIAHDRESTQRLFQMVKLFHDRLPEHKKLPTKYASKREFLWPQVNSYFFVGTAGSGEFGRGGTINNVHASEAAFWKDADKIVAGLLESVPVDGNVFVESTANGIGNYYQEEYERSKNGDSIFSDRFFGWFENPEYRLPITGGFVRTEEEEGLAEAYDLDDEQLNWRRWKKKTLREKFEQEYPSNPVEAFLSSGHPYFDRAQLADITQNCPPPIEFDCPEAASRLRRERRFLKVWKTPQPGRGYVISADTAEGLTDKGDPDFDSASVWDAETWEQVAHLHGRWDTHEFGLLLAELGFWYNTALLGIERNNHGHAVINAAMHTANYPPMISGQCRGLYFHEEYDEKKQQKARKPGWPTTPKTKYFALDGLATSILDGDITINSLEMLAELNRFVKLPGGRAGGEASSHDDRVMDAAIGDVLLKLGLWKRTLTPLNIPPASRILGLSRS